jgi:hypothetical protein
MTSPNQNQQNAAPVPPAPTPTTPAPAPATNANGQPQMSQEELERKSREYRDKFNELLQGNPALQQIANFLGFGSPPDPAAQAANTVFGEVVRSSLIGGGNLKSFDGKEETVSANLKQQLQEMFDAKPPRLVFDADPAKNKAEFDQLMGEIDSIVKEAHVQRTQYDPGVILARMTDKVRELGADVTVRVEAKLPDLTKKIEPNDHVKYGAPVNVNAGNLDKLGFAPKLTANAMSPGGEMYDTIGTIKSADLTKALGENFTVQRVVQDGQNHGYFLSNAKGEGFYVGSDALDLNKMKTQAPEIYNAMLAAEPVAAPAPTPGAPAPVMQQQQTVGAPSI